MAYNLPDGCRDNEPEAPWNQKEIEYDPCEICGGERFRNRFTGNIECFECGTTDPENIKICSMCGDNRPKVKTSDNGFRAECSCGVCGQYAENAEAAVTSWNLLNKINH